MEQVKNLDFTNNGGVTLEDIDFGEAEIVEPTVVVPLVTEEEEGNEPVVETKEDVKLEDLDFEGDEPEQVDDKPKRITKDLRVEAVKAVLKKKLDRYDIEADVDLDSMDEETLAEFEEQLDQAVLETKWNGIKGQSKNLEKLLSFIENGGDPQKILSLFQEQQEVAKLDLTASEGQAKLVKSYYTDVLGWSPEKVENRVERLLANGQLEDEVKDVKDAYDQHFEESQNKKIQAQEEKALREQQLQQQKRLMFEKTLADSKIPKRLQDEYKTVAFGKGVLKGTEEKIDILDYKILQMQANPELFLKLVQFVTDPASYDQVVLQNQKNATVVRETKKGFQFEKGEKQSDNVAVQRTESKKKFEFQFN